MDSRMISVGDDVALHVAHTGEGPDVVVLSGGPGCVHYLADERIAPEGVRVWFPDPRGVGRSGGGPHDMATAIADLEAIREQLGLDTWVVLGHSWGSDLAVRYALDHPERIRGVIGIAGRGLQYDRLWSAEYERLQHTESDIDIDFVPEVHEVLKESFRRWIHHPQLFRALADSVVPMQFIAAENDIRPSWPLQQLAELVPGGSFETVPRVAHNFWATDPDTWVEITTRACAEVGSRVAQAKG